MYWKIILKDTLILKMNVLWGVYVKFKKLYKSLILVKNVGFFCKGCW